METLNLSDSTPRSESRLKSLFWPSIQSGSDVDYLGSQGYWVCTFLAVTSLLILVWLGEPLDGVLAFLFIYLSGVGVRERSTFAATAVFFFYVIDTFVARLSVVRILFGALLLSNLRATWIASRWVKGSDDAAIPPRLNETLGDKFADKLPEWLWPKIRILYYVLACCYLTLLIVGLAAAPRGESAIQ